MSENNSKQKITAIAITCNDGDNAKQIIENCSFADEIIFLDDNGLDNTVEIAKNINIKVFKKDFNGTLNEQKFAVEQATYDWICFINGDEIISEKLKLEIKDSIENQTSKLAFFCDIDFNFLGKKIKFGGYNNAKSLFLFHKNYMQQTDIETNNSSAILKNTLKKLGSKSFDNYNVELSFASTVMAKKLFDKKLKPTFYHLLILPILHFFKHFIFNRGILDGKEGFILAYINAFATLKCYLQLWLMYRNIN